jgi:hypothetical protein
MATISITLTNESNNALTSITVKGNISGVAPVYGYTLGITYAPSGSPNDKTQHLINNVTVTPNQPFEFTDSLSGLKTQTTYIVTASLYPSNKITTIQPIASTSITVLTPRLSNIGGTFRCSQRSASVITMELSDMPRLEYAVRVDFKYKKRTDTNYITAHSFVVEANEDRVMSWMFTGLTSSTQYQFSASVYKAVPFADGSDYIGTYALSVTTKDYVSGGDDIVPSFKRYIFVPNLDYGYIQAETSEPLTEQFTVHLYTSLDGETYTDEGAITNAFHDKVIEYGEGVRYLKLAIVDTNDEVHNESEVLEAGWSTLPAWTSISSGDPLVLPATTVLAWANAMLKLYDFDIAVRHATPSEDTIQYLAYHWLAPNLYRIATGSPIEAEVLNSIFAIAEHFTEPDPDEAEAEYLAHKANAGDPITASFIETYVYGLLNDAIDNYTI